MPERKIKVPLRGESVEAVEVTITETLERWTEVRLEDGAILRVKPSVIGVARIEGKYDQEGNPMYAVRAAQIVSIASVPEILRKPKSPLDVQ